jgi:formylglycine-generating enzyme required for sulfatase activity
LSKSYDGLNPLDTFKECANCPEMVVVAAGKFVMGATASEEGYLVDEGPQREVTIERKFAVSKFEATFDEWALAWLMAAAHGTPPTRAGGGVGNL